MPYPALVILMEEFLQDYALEAQPSKGYIFGSNNAVRDKLKKRLRMLGQKLQKPVEAARILGAHVHFGKRKRRGTHTDRLKEATTRAQRTGCLPLPRMIKAEIVGSAVIPMALHGALTTLLPTAALKSLRAACSTAIWGKHRLPRRATASTQCSRSRTNACGMPGLYSWDAQICPDSSSARGSW